MPLTVKKFFQMAFVVLAFFALVMVSAVITMKVMTWGRTVSVPDVRGMELTAAINQIRNSGLDIKVERQEHHPTVPQNFIIGQSPPPGERVKSGRNVMVVVSQGSEEVAVPLVSGQVFRLAQVMLKQAGLILGEVTHANSPQPSEEVMLQSPPQGTVLQKGSKVDMLVSAGGRGTRFVTPDLTGMTLPQAGNEVRPMGGKVLYSGRGGIIVSQAPKAGHQLPLSGQISVALGNRAAPQPKPTPASQPPKPQEKASAVQPVKQNKAPAAQPPKKDKPAPPQPPGHVLNPMN